MEPLLATRSISLAEFEHSPAKVLQQSKLENIAVLSNDKPTAYVLGAQVFEAMVEQLHHLKLREQILAGERSGEGISSESVFAELEQRYHS